jgi:hypothetical protein
MHRMKHLVPRPPLLTLFMALCAQPAWSHDGHGLWGAHWHASDAFGFVALAAAIGVALWISRK